MWRAAVFLALLAGACGSDGVFPCQSSNQCVHLGDPGVCEATGFCSFTDLACTSTRRYGDYAPVGLADECVPPGGGMIVTKKLEPVADTWITSDQTGTNYGVSGDLRADGADKHLILLRFDLVPSIPAGSQVQTATLSFSTTSIGGLTQGSTEVFRLLEDWTEGTKSGSSGQANWTQRTSTSNWMAAGAGGGSRDPTSIAELVPSQNDTRYNVALPPSTVQGWVDAPTSNHGLLLMDKNAGSAGVIFYSRESNPSSRRPNLTVVYVAP